MNRICNFRLILQSLVIIAFGGIQGYMTALILPNFIFYTTKPLNFMGDIWLAFSACMFSGGWLALFWISRIRCVSASVVRMAILRGLLNSLIVSVVVALGFAWAHRNYQLVESRIGDFFEFIGPLFGFVLATGISTTLLLVSISKRSND